MNHNKIQQPHIKKLKQKMKTIMAPTQAYHIYHFMIQLTHDKTQQPQTNNNVFLKVKTTHSNLINSEFHGMGFF